MSPRTGSRLQRARSALPDAAPRSEHPAKVGRRLIHRGGRGARERSVPRRVQHPLPARLAAPHPAGSKLRSAGLGGRRRHLAVQLRAVGRRRIECGARVGQRRVLPGHRRGRDPGELRQPDALERRRLHLADLDRIGERSGGLGLLSGSNGCHVRARRSDRLEWKLHRCLPRRRHDVRRAPSLRHARPADRRRDCAVEEGRRLRHLGLDFRSYLPRQ